MVGFGYRLERFTNLYLEIHILHIHRVYKKKPRIHTENARKVRRKPGLKLGSGV